LGKVSGRAALSLKWPNDVLVNGRKAAGILLESSGRGGQLDWLSVGIGVNLAAAPDPGTLEEGAVAPISVAEVAGTVPTPEEFLTELAIAFDGIYAQFVKYGFDPIRRAWLAHAARLGDRIVARTGREEIAGRFDTIDAEGNLVLFTDQGPRAIAAADVFF
jgi:BirA family biotin operon repressor/biotin-[acetyl-CoA-carboxylase] ligase